MNQHFQNRIWALVVCGAVVFLLLLTAKTPVAAATQKPHDIVNAAENAGTQLLWESLSHQFFAAVQH